jgi:hypothetical protein
MASDDSKSTIPFLSDDPPNYTTWLVDIRAILRQKKLWDLIQTPFAIEMVRDEYRKVKDESGEGTTVTSVMGLYMNKPGQKICGHCRKSGHDKAHCFQLQTCKECGTLGHIQKHCPKATTATANNTTLSPISI